MSSIITTASTALPRDIDVRVNISKAQTEATVDLNILCFVGKSGFPDSFSHDASRIRYYSTLAAVADDFAASSEPYKAAQAFFSQSPRAKTLAIARVFDSAQAGYLQCGPLAQKTLAQWKAITNGSFIITINGVPATLTDISFAAITAEDDIASVVQSALRAVTPASEAFGNATATYSASGIRIRSGVAGNDSSVSYLSAADSGTDLSVLLNGAYQEDSEIQPAYTVVGYDPNEEVEGGTTWNFKGELDYIRQAASANRFVYGWALEKQFRDTSAQLELAEWVESQTYGIAGLTTNSPLAVSASSSADVGSILSERGYRRSFACYHDNPYYYPEVAILSYALSVNYSMEDSTITTKFKSLQGIPTVPVTESELGVLNKKRINTYTLVGISARTFREGVESDPQWFIDDLINLDNFRETLQVEVYNVFLRNKKVPYNVRGVTLLYEAMDRACSLYAYNGTFTERPLTEAEKLETGLEVEPAYTINITPIEQMTIADRANRIGPPAVIKVNLAGAIHSIDISVEAYS